MTSESLFLVETPLSYTPSSRGPKHTCLESPTCFLEKPHHVARVPKRPCRHSSPGLRPPAGLAAGPAADRPLPMARTESGPCGAQARYVTEPGRLGQTRLSDPCTRRFFRKSNRGMGRGRQSQTVWIDPSSTSNPWVELGKRIGVSKPRFPHLWNGDSGD